MTFDKPKKLESVIDRLRTYDPTDAVANRSKFQRDDRARTSPGHLGEFMKLESEVMIENDVIRTKLVEFQTSAIAKKIPAECVARSKWANRHATSFTDIEFLKLKKEIDSSGGNVQPIKVRPLAKSPGKFEVIFGHRRHQACLELGLPILAMIDEATDQQLFAEMDRENRLRKDLRPYEQGLMYRRALDEGLFPSARKMAESIGVDLAGMGRSLALARLPDFIVSAFSSPLDLQLHWAAPLTQAIQKDPDFIKELAHQIQGNNSNLSAKKIFEKLTHGGVVSDNPPSVFKVSGQGGQFGTIELDSSKSKFAVNLENISRSQMEKLNQMIQDFLKSNE